MEIATEKLKPEQRALLRDIEQRWRHVPPLRVAVGEKDAFEDWPLGDFGPDDTRGGETAWLATNRVHASEMLMNAPEICAVMAASRDDVRALFKLVGELLVDDAP